MFASLAAFFVFFTRIPVRWQIKDFAKAYKQGVWLLPVFGFIYGLIPGLVFCLFNFLTAKTSIAWALAILTDVVVTGGMHYDGLADSSDGLFSGRDAEKIRAIMRDSRIGTFGSLALILFTLLFYTTGAAVLDNLSHWYDGLIRVASFFAVEKAGMSISHYRLKYAGLGAHGQGQIAENVKDWQVVLAQIVCFMIVALIYSWKGLLAYALSFLCVNLYIKFVYKKLGGMSGDTVGSTAQYAIISFLLSLVCLNNFWG